MISEGRVLANEEVNMSSTSLASCASDCTSSTSAGLSSYVSVTKDGIYDKCPRCRVQFDFLKRPNSGSSKVPLILNCKHTVCEDCIRKMCITGVTACPVCKEKFAVTRAQLDSLMTIFTPHFSLIGQLLWTKNSPSKGYINFVSTGQTLKSKQNSGVDLLDTSDSATVDAGLSSDEMEDFEEENPKKSLEFDKCSEHTDAYANIYCQNCDDTVCCYCFLENHVSHLPIYLYKLDNAGVDLNRLKFEMEVILKELVMSRKTHLVVNIWYMNWCSKDLGYLNCVIKVVSKILKYNHT